MIIYFALSTAQKSRLNIVTVYYHANKFRPGQDLFLCDLHLTASAYKSRRLAHSLFSSACNIKRKLNKKKCKKVSSALSQSSTCVVVAFVSRPRRSFFLKVSIFSDEGENTLWGGFEMSFSSRSPTIALRERPAT